MHNPIYIRSATASDASELLSIYRPFVEGTAVSFELVSPSVEEFASRIDKATAGWQWLLAEQAGSCLGYAYAASHRERPAYRWSVEVSVYVHSLHHRKGVGRMLYVELFKRLEAQGFCQALAGIALPNESSVALHRELGFDPIGVFRAVGRKFGAWHDVAWFQKTLREEPPVE